MSQLAKSSKIRILFKTHWHYLYFVLAAFNVLAIFIILFFSHQALNEYKNSVRLTERQIKILHQIASVSEALQQENIVGNDIFRSKSPKEEKFRLTHAASDFDRQLNELFVSIRSSNQDLETNSHKLHTETVIKSAIDRARHISGKIFALDHKDQSNQLSLILEMNKSYLEVNKSIEHLHHLHQREIIAVLEEFQAI